MTKYCKYSCQFLHIWFKMKMIGMKKQNKIKIYLKIIFVKNLKTFSSQIVTSRISHLEHSSLLISSHLNRNDDNTK
jgi:hypothetical protein